MQIKHHSLTAMLATASMMLGASAAWAHAELKQATPAVDGAVQAAPAEVTLKFSERLEYRLAALYRPLGISAQDHQCHLQTVA